MSKNPYEEFPHIATDELTLRKIVLTDLSSLYEIYSNEKFFQYSPCSADREYWTIMSK